LSLNPFGFDPEIRARIAALETEAGIAVRDAVSRALAETERSLAENMGGVLPAKAASAICAAHGINADELLLLSLGAAQRFAHPSISEFYVGAVGREAGTGNLVFGGNLEFTGAHIGNTVHGEGFVFTRAFSRGTAIQTLAIGEAHPCAHCRQYLSEFAAAQNLVLIDPLGHRLRMADLYPWPFDPDYLGETGIVAGAVPHPQLELRPHDLPARVAAALTRLGQRSYTPYGKAPAAMVFILKDGALIGGGAIESVSFNPTISPIQAAMVDLFAHGYAAGDIGDAIIATKHGAQVDYILHTVDALAVIAPGVALRMLAWA
jgi:cytidine deaminase